MPNKKPFNVVITDCDFASIEIEKKELENIAHVTLHQCRTEEEVMSVAYDADGILVQYAPMTRKVIASLNKCKVISRYGIGIDMIDIQAATDDGIAVVNVPDYCIEEVSDHTVALILACIRKIVVFDTTVKSGSWDVRVAAPIYRLQGSSLGLIGFGNIAKRIVQKIAGFGCRVLVCDPYVSSDVLEQYHVTSVSFEDVLRKADIISIHAPLTNETKHLFSEREFRLMKETACIVNTSRGPIIDETTLYKALKERWIAGAAIDVVEEEPLRPESALLKLDNIIITPHASFYSVTALQELQKQTARGVVQVLKGETPTHLVNSLLHI